MSVKNKATGTSHEVYFAYSLISSVTLVSRGERLYYIHRRGAFGDARFGQTGQCEGLNSVERATDWLHVFHVYIPWIN